MKIKPRFYLAIFFAVYLIHISCKKDDKANCIEDCIFRGNATISILDFSSGTTISGVSVFLKKNANSTNTLTTNADGKVIFPDICPGTYEIQLQKSGFDAPSSKVCTITIDCDNQNAQTDCSLVALNPELCVSNTSLNFGTSKSVLPLEICNKGGGKLTWEITSTDSWISFNGRSGEVENLSETVNVTVLRDGLPSGPFQGSFTVSTKNGGGSQEISVIGEVEPKFVVTPANLDFGSDTESKSFEVVLTKPGTVTFSVEAFSDEGWLSTVQTGGTISSSSGSSQKIDVKVNRSGLAYKMGYPGHITIDGGSGGIERVDVAMDYIDPFLPSLDIPSQNIDFGTTDFQKTIIIQNTGGGLLEWDVSNSKDWLTVSPSSGSIQGGASEVLTLNVNRYNVSEGAHPDKLIFNSNGGEGEIHVEMEVSSLFTELNSFLLAYYTFEENVNDIVNDFDGANNGVGFSNDTPTGMGYSAVFSPSSESHISIGSNPFYNLSEGTICFWIKTPSPNSTQCVIHGSNLLDKRGFNLILNGNPNYDPYGVIYNEPYVYTSGRIEWNYGENKTFSVPIDEVLADNKWHFIAFTIQSGKQYLYIDGTRFSNSGASSFEGVSSNKGMIIGQYLDKSEVGLTQNVGEFFLNARIDNLRMYERVLNQEELALILELGL